MKRTAITLLVVLSTISIVAAYAWAQWQTSNYTEQGGARTVVGGSIDIVSGGEIDVESGGALKIGGTAVTSTAAELNILDTVTAAAAELNYLDVTAAGTLQASKAIIVDATKQIDDLITTDDVTVGDDLGVTGDATFSGNLTLDSRAIEFAQYSADPNAASWLATFTGVDADDYIIATVNLPTNGAYLLSAQPSVDGVTITLSADPGGSVTVTMIALED